MVVVVYNLKDGESVEIKAPNIEDALVFVYLKNKGVDPSSLSKTELQDVHHSISEGEMTLGLGDFAVMKSVY